ncbi:flavoprotein [Arthrobacter sp. LFS091]|uniref:flavoprotein n=1 Tax=Arthrobacter sp. LFS091 TaxID=3229892 RepID=UPI003A80BA03
MAKLMQNPPILDIEKLILVVTGSINAALVPYWLNWFRNAYPDVITSLIITQSAERFVTYDALKHLANGAVWRDSWDEPGLPGGSHIGLDESADCFGIFPATLDYTMRLASGRTNSPSLMALQLTEKPVAVAASFPGTNPVHMQALKNLELRENMAFTDKVAAFSVGRKAWSGQTGFFMPLLASTLAGLISAQANG